jgi:hypothetical protein
MLMTVRDEEPSVPSWMQAPGEPGAAIDEGVAHEFPFPPPAPEADLLQEGPEEVLSEVGAEAQDAGPPEEQVTRL